MESVIVKEYDKLNNFIENIIQEYNLFIIVIS